VALGDATKTIPIITESLKAYNFNIIWGSQTNTDDQEGDVIETSSYRPGKENIEAALQKFRGQIMQIPPQFSAVKVNGERAYIKARKGEKIELKSRPLWVNSLSIIEILNKNSVSLRMECGKGGYVRAIARDLGKELGCFAHIKSLRRTDSGPFNVKNTIQYDLFAANGRNSNLDHLILPLEIGLKGVTEIEIDIEGAVKLRQGQSISISNCKLMENSKAWVSLNKKAVAMVNLKSNRLYPSKVFSQNDS
jgi:tRNA pseudouridine55 synthase